MWDNAWQVLNLRDVVQDAGLLAIGGGSIGLANAILRHPGSHARFALAGSAISFASCTAFFGMARYLGGSCGWRGDLASDPPLLHR
jgi:hypothetical protein